MQTYLGVVGTARLSRFLSPRALDVLSIQIGIVNRDNGLRGRLFRGEPIN